MVFFALLIIQNLMKCFFPTGACINYHEKSKNINFSSSKCPNHKRARQRATRWAEKSVLRHKKSQLTKFSPNLLKFGLRVHHQVSCSLKEVSAKIMPFHASSMPSSSMLPEVNMKSLVSWSQCQNMLSRKGVWEIRQWEQWTVLK